MTIHAISNLDKHDVFKIIDGHYKANYKSLVKKYSGPSGSQHNAQDVIQEAYARACQYWRSFNIDRNFDNWFNRILVNCLKDIVKDNKDHGANGDDAPVAEIQPEAYNKVVLNEVFNMIEEQPENISYILKLYYIEQYTSKEISYIVPETHVNIRRIILVFSKKLKAKFDVQQLENQ